MYLACAAVMGFIFVLCSFWIFQNADLEFDDIFLESQELHEGNPGRTETNTAPEHSDILKHRAVSWKPISAEPAQRPTTPDTHPGNDIAG